MADASSIVQQNLLDAKAKLLAQEQEVLAQLEQIRKGIESIETTIDVVCGDGSIVPVKTKSTKVAKATATTSASVSSSADTNGAAPKSAAPVRKTARGRAKSTKAPKATAKPSTKKAAKASSGRVLKRNNAGWQSYLHDEFKDMALTEVVETVFSRSPKTAMSSADLIDKIFTSDIPKAERTAARDRLLNILSIGVNENKWYRVKPGQYSISKDAQ